MITGNNIYLLQSLRAILAEFLLIAVVLLLYHYPNKAFYVCYVDQAPEEFAPKKSSKLMK